jgi:translation initiation factor IF-1
LEAGTDPVHDVNPGKTSHPDEIRAPARVIELLRDGACRVELPNGHRAVGQSREHQCKLGDAVIIAFHPYDLSRGWILSARATSLPSSGGHPPGRSINAVVFPLDQPDCENNEIPHHR